MTRLKTLAALLLLVVSATAEDAAEEGVPYAARRERLRARIESGLALVPGAPAAEPFREDNDFWYLTGLEWPGVVLALTEDGAWLFTPDGTEPAPPGFDGVLAMDMLDVTLGRYAADGLWLPGGRSEFYSTWNRPGERREFGDPFGPSKRRLEWISESRKRVEGEKVRALEPKLTELRQVKDRSEIECLRRACRVTGESLVEAIRSVKPGMKEREFQDGLERGYLERGARWLAFPSIVGSGRNGTMVHYTENSAEFDRNELVVVDTGAEIGMYAADITRTFPVNGKFTQRQREVYEAVLAAQDAAIAALKPGVTLGEVDAIARQVLKDRGFTQRMPHLTSHWVGLQVHDVGDYAARLKPGMVVTVEPGIYLEDEEIGVRIEDVLVVTGDGAESLTSWIPRGADEIERLTGADLK